MLTSHRNIWHTLELELVVRVIDLAYSENQASKYALFHGTQSQTNIS